jgi:predicted permease
VTLALGIGASTAVFSVVNAVLLRPLPYVEPDRLVELFESNPTGGIPSIRASALNYLSWAERSKSFDALAAFGSIGLTLTGNGDPELVGGSAVTASLFEVLRVTPIVGRTLQPEDERREGSRVAVLGEHLWRSRFGGDRSLVGRSITLDGEPYQVVGVMPRTFREVGRTQATTAAGGQVFVPMVIDRAQENRGNHTLRVVGRLRRDLSVEQARDEMRAVSAGMELEFPATNRNWGVLIERVSDTMLEPQVPRSLLLVLGAVTMVVLIACANVANLMLARGTRRRGELALRGALGAGRSRLLRQLLTESSLIVMTSGAAGILAAALIHPLVRTMLPATLPRLEEMQLDTSVLAFGLLVSMVSGLVFGVVPALRASRLDLAQSLAIIGRASTDSSRGRLRHLLIGCQVAVATMLLIGAALLLQGLVRLQRVPLGFEPDGVLTARIALPRDQYADAGRVGQFYERLVSTLQASGQMRSVALATSAPFGPGVRASFRLMIRRDASRPGAETEAAAEQAAEHIVNGEYFQVLGIPLRAGRSFTERDTTGAAGVAIVSERVVRRLWPDGNPLGQMVERSGRPYEIVGVVGDVRGSDTQGTRGGSPDREPRAAVYFAAGQHPQRAMTLLARPGDELADVPAAIRQAVRQLDPSLAVQQVRPLQEWLGESVAPALLTTRLATIFGVTALLLAAVGIYGVVASVVASRTREIGVRMAIGATRRQVLGLVLREGMTWAGGGIVAGLVGASAAAGLIATILFDTPPRDPFTFATVGAAVTLVALAATAIPALRAVHVDPAIAIRTE